MKIDILTLFPKMLEGFVSESILGRAVREGHVDLTIHNLRDWSQDAHHTVDDRPFGGGAGMVLKADVLARAIQSLRTQNTRVIYLCPDGMPLKTETVKTLAGEQHLILISGHYEGIDERFREQNVDEEISIGDYVLTNGTLPAAVLVDVIMRYVPNVLGDKQSLQQDSFSNTFLTFPQYTRPLTFNDAEIPSILFSGNHETIARWRLEQQMLRTIRRRPDLIFN